MSFEADENNGLLRVGVAACFFHHDPTRPIFKGKRLLYVEESMIHWLMRHGALPVLIPTEHGNVQTEHYLDQVDALLLQGGSDVSPLTYGEEPLRPEWSGDRFRDLYEADLIRQALGADKPILGICRGHQILNAALGGSLYQDIELQVAGARVHRNWEVYDQLRHDIVVEPGSGLLDTYRHEISKSERVGRIISIHHQAVKDLAPALRAEAYSTEDGLVEAVRLTDAEKIAVRDETGLVPLVVPHAALPYAVGLQWHPEFQQAGEALLPPEPMLEEFLREARERKRRRAGVAARV